MKNDIYLLGDTFEQEITACKHEERAIRKIVKRYEEVLSNHRINNQERSKLINNIRLNKIKEINEEIDKSNLEIEELKKKQRIFYMLIVKEMAITIF